VIVPNPDAMNGPVFLDGLSGGLGKNDFPFVTIWEQGLKSLPAYCMGILPPHIDDFVTHDGSLSNFRSLEQGETYSPAAIPVHHVAVTVPGFPSCRRCRLVRSGLRLH